MNPLLSDLPPWLAEERASVLPLAWLLAGVLVRAREMRRRCQGSPPPAGAMGPHEAGCAEPVPLAMEAAAVGEALREGMAEWAEVTRTTDPARPAPAPRLSVRVSVPIPPAEDMAMLCERLALRDEMWSYVSPWRQSTSYEYIAPLPRTLDQVAAASGTPSGAGPAGAPAAGPDRPAKGAGKGRNAGEAGSGPGAKASVERSPSPPSMQCGLDQAPSLTGGTFRVRTTVRPVLRGATGHVETPSLRSGSSSSHPKLGPAGGVEAAAEAGTTASQAKLLERSAGLVVTHEEDVAGARVTLRTVPIRPDGVCSPLRFVRNGRRSWSRREDAINVVSDAWVAARRNCGEPNHPRPAAATPDAVSGNMRPASLGGPASEAKPIPRSPSPPRGAWPSASLRSESDQDPGGAAAHGSTPSAKGSGFAALAGPPSEPFLPSARMIAALGADACSEAWTNHQRLLAELRNAAAAPDAPREAAATLTVAYIAPVAPESLPALVTRQTVTHRMEKELRADWFRLVIGCESRGDSYQAAERGLWQAASEQRRTGSGSAPHLGPARVTRWAAIEPHDLTAWLTEGGDDVSPLVQAMALLQPLLTLGLLVVPEGSVLAPDEEPGHEYHRAGQFMAPSLRSEPLMAASLGDPFASVGVTRNAIAALGVAPSAPCRSVPMRAPVLTLWTAAFLARGVPPPDVIAAQLPMVRAAAEHLTQGRVCGVEELLAEWGVLYQDDAAMTPPSTPRAFPTSGSMPRLYRPAQEHGARFVARPKLLLAPDDEASWSWQAGGDA